MCIIPRYGFIHRLLIYIRKQSKRKDVNYICLFVHDNCFDTTVIYFEILILSSKHKGFINKQTISVFQNAIQVTANTACAVSAKGKGGGGGEEKNGRGEGQDWGEVQSVQSPSLSFFLPHSPSPPPPFPFPFSLATQATTNMPIM